MLHHMQRTVLACHRRDKRNNPTSTRLHSTILMGTPGATCSAAFTPPAVLLVRPYVKSRVDLVSLIPRILNSRPPVDDLAGVYFMVCFLLCVLFSGAIDVEAAAAEDDAVARSRECLFTNLRQLLKVP